MTESSPAAVDDVEAEASPSANVGLAGIVPSVLLERSTAVGGDVVADDSNSSSEWST